MKVGRGSYICNVSIEGRSWASLSFRLQNGADGEEGGVFENLDDSSLLSTFFACTSLKSNTNGRVAIQKTIHQERVQPIIL